MPCGKISSVEYYSPLRYPGGKGKLAPFVESVFETNNLCDAYYVEPFAGGASVALSLLVNEYARRIYINDLDRSIYAFWHSVLNETEALCRLIRNTPVTVGTWKRQKQIQRNKQTADVLSLGFSTFFLNRTNRSGILNGGIIGGLSQCDRWKIDARYNKPELIKRIERVAFYRHRIHLSNTDATQFVSKIRNHLPPGTLLYFDPPYYVKGRALYHNYFLHEDHKGLSDLVRDLTAYHWIVSYDNTPEIRKMYTGFKRLQYSLHYCAASSRNGHEVMFFSEKTKRPSKITTPFPVAQREAS